MQELTPEQKKMFAIDSNGDGVPDIVDDPDQFLNNYISPDGTTMTEMQKKLFKTVIKMMGKEKASQLSKEISESGNKPLHHENMHTVKDVTGVWSKMSDNKKELIRIFLILDAAVVLFAMYYFFGR
ncbi:MAG: hypothetical protein COX82_02635 [Candidatus Magasanikbacteria bacterium CG_4_10_14_0_2_um_filter_41_10]|uniref:Uncharacterized protein n=1 Tax=Candidatus Magasanikbacteria bacterium CG_4_10_14_0_2_um_filter_41_10 TaxID=1974638 RepID=A0A2M7V4F7_9BACT|nr:MAG: hypothetical protein COX82_02635 [Candidatus Magasanikbacteria bacterium CG_4_10_14_0_2_um_filter_41_10]